MHKTNVQNMFKVNNKGIIKHVLGLALLSLLLTLETWGNPVEHLRWIFFAKIVNGEKL